MLGIAALAIAGIAGSLIAAPVHAATTVTCLPYDTGNVTYPTDNAGANPPTMGHAFRCASSPGGLKPTDARADTLFGAMRNGQAGFPFPTTVRTRLKNENVNYFFFNNRTEADDYFANTSPYKDVLIPIHSFKGANNTPPGGTRCGNTGYGYVLSQKVIAVAIYDTCYYDNVLVPNKVVVNQSLERTIFHETGHAFDFTFGNSIQQAAVLSNKQGFKDLANADINGGLGLAGLTPTNWATMNAAARDVYVCKLFPPIKYPHDLERDFGATYVSPGNGGPNGEVCNASSVRYAPYKASPANVANDLTPTQIAKVKLPYFTTGQFYYQELFAELFVVQAFSTGSPVTFLQFTDATLANNLVSPRAFNCTRGVLSSYITTGAAPTSIAGCPSPLPSPL